MGGGASLWMRRRRSEARGQEAALFGELRAGGRIRARAARGTGRWDLCVSWDKVKEKLGS